MIWEENPLFSETSIYLRYPCKGYPTFSFEKLDPGEAFALGVAPRHEAVVLPAGNSRPKGIPKCQPPQEIRPGNLTVEITTMIP